MLRGLVNTIRNNANNIESGTLFISNITINEEEKKCIEFLEENNILENTNYTNKIGEIVDLELSLPDLNTLGYYQDIDTLIIKSKYAIVHTLYYIHEIDKFSDDPNTSLFEQYYAVITFINAVRAISKHIFSEAENDFAVIYRDDKSLVLPFIYSSERLRALTSKQIESLQAITETFIENDSERKFLCINELIDFTIDVQEDLRFNAILENITIYKEKCDWAYQYYLRNFSFNKLKIELDSKALEFTQKIQSVINDSQTKLITIPTAFVLVASTFDYENLTSMKNIATIGSLFIFAVIIQIFLHNQYSSLKFTKSNIDAYRETFSNDNIDVFLEKFQVVDIELSKQRLRLNIVTILLWAIPVLFLIIWIIMLLTHEVGVSKAHIILSLVIFRGLFCNFGIVTLFNF